MPFRNDDGIFEEAFIEVRNMDWAFNIISKN
jgi:hypothetical protein